MQFKQVLMTPEMASAIMARNTSNRPIRPMQVRTLVDAIKRGDWSLNHQPIAVSTAGVLLDGQHRLAAVIESGVPVPMMVATGADPSSFDTIDVGARRSMSDIFKTNGTITSVISTIASIHRTNERHSLSPREMSKYFDVFGKRIAEFYEFTSTCRASLTSAPIRTACFIRGELFGDMAYCYPQMRHLSTANFNAMSPAVRSLASQALGTHKIDRRQMFEKASYAFNEKNENVAKIAIRTHGKIITETRAAIDNEFARMGVPMTSNVA